MSNMDKDTSNSLFSRQFYIFKKKLPWEKQPDRSITINTPDIQIGNNEIHTAKYNPINFVPLTLFEQFSRLSNFYFLILGALSMIPMISATDGKPVVYVPLSIIITVNTIKNVLEDYKRHKSDRSENDSSVQLDLTQRP